MSCTRTVDVTDAWACDGCGAAFGATRAAGELTLAELPEGLVTVHLRVRSREGFEPYSWQGELCSQCLRKPIAELLPPLAVTSKKDEP